MRSPRSVTIAPIALPSRSLNAAIERRALVTTGFWPVIASRSRTAALEQRLLLGARPTPQLTTIFSRRGTSITLRQPELALQLVADLRGRSGAAAAAARCVGGGAHSASPHFAQTRHLLAVGVDLVAHPVGPSFEQMIATAEPRAAACPCR